jgi:hypothetical protein
MNVTSYFFFYRGCVLLKPWFVVGENVCVCVVYPHSLLETCL